MRNNISFTDYINDSIRVLIIASAVKDRKSIKLTENKIKLYDYYLKFPKTMFDTILLDDDEIKANFDEYYAFFHWKPDLIKYRQSINFLIAKGLLEKHFESNNLYFSISDKGEEAIIKLNNGYKSRLMKIAKIMVKEASKLASDTKIEDEITRKSSVLARNIRGGMGDER